MKLIYNDGGRKAAGYKGSTGDCVTRAIAIATEQSYEAVYQAMADGNFSQRQPRLSARARTRRESARKRAVRTASDGILVKRKWFKDYMTGLGWRWTPTMLIGSGCKVHLIDGELPMGRLIVSVSKHYTCVIDGVIHDTHDPQREPGEVTVWYKPGTTEVARKTVSGGRCVYGYWSKA